MLKEELLDLAHEIQRLGAEQQTIEAKAAHDGCPRRLYDTLSSFANQDSGGIIIFGLDEASAFAVVGVYDVQDLQKKVTEQCLQMEPVIRPLFTVAEFDGAPIVSAEVPAVEPTGRPCFYKGKGRLRGSYRRVGESDEPMTEYEIYSYEAYRKKYQDDVRVLPGCTFSMLDPVKLSDYTTRLRARKSHLAKLEDEQIYALVGIEKENGITLSAEWLFGQYPQAFAPQLCIIAVKSPGLSLGEAEPDGTRFADNKRIEGTIPEMLEECLFFLRRNLAQSTKIDPETGERTDTPALPMVAVREIVLNALVHRDYSIHTEGMPIRVVLYSDRLEVENPGGLYGRLTVDNLGKVQPDTRNPVIATAMEDLGLTENRYSGIPTIRKVMAEANKPAPEFNDTGSSFKVTLRFSKQVKSLATAGSKRSGQEEKTDRLLAFCASPKSRKDIADFLGIAPYYAARRYINPLIDEGLLIQTIPEKPRSKNQRYLAK